MRTLVKEADKEIKEHEETLLIIKSLGPTCDEIRSYGEKYAGFGHVTYAMDAAYHGPTLHNTRAMREYGPVHIDIGCGGLHLILDRRTVSTFIQYVKSLRGQA